MAVKVNGKVLREIDNTVALPFGSEYTILLKNLSSKKASVRLKIDGVDAFYGTQLIIDPGKTTEIKRFIKNRNLNAGNAFKFIEKTEQIENYRGNRIEDGLITLEYEFEHDMAIYNKPHPIWTYQPNYPPLPSLPVYPLTPYNPLNDAPVTSNILRSTGSATTLTYNDNNGNIHSAPTKALYSSQNTAGITAPGSVVDQKFYETTRMISDGITHRMTIKLVGEVNNKQVKAPVVVKKTIRCEFCGTFTKQTAKFCHNCGASVQIIR